MPKPLVDAVCEARVVVFAGAGVSSEVRTVLPTTFYDEVRDELGTKDGADLSFSELMSQYCAQHDGRIKLLQKIKQRFKYLDDFPELSWSASRFHRELSTIPLLNEIVTTNWDEYFERYCTCTPFVTPQDFAFWSLPGRKVHKIHGSVSSFGSIIATTEDYERCHNEIFAGLVGANLKMLFATKTILFAGYSLHDQDFLRLYHKLRGEMGDVFPQPYIVTPHAEDSMRLKELGIVPIITDATHLMEVMKAQLVARRLMRPDSQFSCLEEEHSKLLKAHREMNKFSLSETPSCLYALCYQDGMMHGLERVMARKSSGEYSHVSFLRDKVRTYTIIRKDKLSRGRYADVSYIDGYIDALLFLEASPQERKCWNHYSLPGWEYRISNVSEFKHALKKHKPPRAYLNFAKRMVARLADGVVFHHIPQL
jgi:hypothetical protein